MKKNKNKNINVLLIFYIILIIINILLTISLSFNLVRKDIHGNVIPRHKITLGVILNLILHILILLLGCFAIIKYKDNLILIWSIIIFVGILPIIIMFVDNTILNNIETSGNIFIWLLENGILII